MHFTIKHKTIVNAGLFLQLAFMTSFFFFKFTYNDFNNNRLQILMIRDLFFHISFQPIIILKNQVGIVKKKFNLKFKFLIRFATNKLINT